MKRFFKTGAACVLALALMSTSAFAAVTKEGSSVGFDETGKLDVTVAGTTADEQVALMVLKGTKTTDDLANVKNTDIAYIDQKAGTASLAFSDINVGTVETVTVFAGSTNTASAILLGTATAKQYTLTANTASFNVAKGVETLVDLTLTNQDKQTVTVATVTYKVKDSADEFVDASSLVRYDGGWKFNFNAAGTYQVKFTKDGADAVVVVCVYEKNLPVENIGKKDDPQAEKKPFVMKKAPDSTKVVAAVQVTINESQSGAGKLIWSITTADGAHYYSKSADWNTTGVSGTLAIGCKFDNDTNSEVTAVNVIYKDATGKVFFTDESDAGRESK